MGEWLEKRMDEIAEINPRETIKKGTIAKKVAMDKLKPFCRDVPGFELEAFSGGTKFRNGDTIMARITPCLENGKTAKVDVLNDDEVGFGSTEYIVFRAKEGNDPDFIYYLVTSSVVREPAIKSMIGSSGRQRVQNDVVQGLMVRIPDLEGQKAIAGILKALDDKIAVNRRVNENLFHQLHVLYSNIEHTGRSFSEVSLGTLCTFQEGYVNPAQTHPEYFDGEVKWLRAVDINEGFIINTSRTLTNEGFQSAKKSAFLFPPNTIAISKSGTIGRLGIVADYMCGNRAVIDIAPNNTEHLPFIYAYLKSQQPTFSDLAVGSVQKNLYVSLLEPLKVVLPDIETLNSFCNVGNDLLELIKNNCQESMKLSNLRDSLLPQLMSGFLDVSNLDL